MPSVLLFWRGLLCELYVLKYVRGSVFQIVDSNEYREALSIVQASPD